MDAAPAARAAQPSAEESLASASSSAPDSIAAKPEAVSNPASTQAAAVNDWPKVKGTRAKPTTPLAMPAMACQLICPDGSARLTGSPAQ